jgi:hypothetical protein
VTGCTAPRVLVFCPLSPKVNHDGHELVRNTTKSFHKPFLNSASCSERSRIDCLTSRTPHLLHVPPPLPFKAPSGVTPPLCANLCSLVIIIITVSLLRFNREPHIYPGAHPLPVFYRYPQQPAVTLVNTSCEKKKGGIEPATHTKLIHAAAAATTSVPRAPTLLIRGR